MPSITAIYLLFPLYVVTLHLGCLGFREDMRVPKNTNVVTHNKSGEEEEAAAIIADAGSH